MTANNNEEVREHFFKKSVNSVNKSFTLPREIVQEVAMKVDSIGSKGETKVGVTWYYDAKDDKLVLTKPDNAEGSPLITQTATSLKGADLEDYPDNLDGYNITIRQDIRDDMYEQYANASSVILIIHYPDELVEDDDLAEEDLPPAWVSVYTYTEWEKRYTDFRPMDEVNN